MKVLILSQYHSPEPAFKSQLLGAGLIQLGHSVTTITGFPNYPEGRIYPGYKQRLWSRENMDGVRLLRLPLYADHSRSGARRALNYLSFAASASLLGPLLCGSAEVMWVYHPPLTVGIPAWLIGALRHIPFVYEIQDMWPETLQSTGMMNSPAALKILTAMARFIYMRACAITVLSPGFKRNLVSKGVPEAKIHVMPNWADEELYRPLPRDEKLATDYGLSGRFNIMFAGNMGAAQALGNVLDAADRLKDLPEMQFVLIGSGVDRQGLEDFVRKRRLLNVRFIDRQPEERIPAFLALADVFLVHLKKDPLFEITIPSKTIAYMACARPILAAIEGDAAEVVQTARAGLVCKPEDPAALEETVRQLYRMSPQQRRAMGDAGRSAFLEQFTKRVLIRRYEDLFINIARHTKPFQHSETPREKLVL
jgi:glycosyltransferase involved in cell wall biosynthesis